MLRLHDAVVWYLFREFCLYYFFQRQVVNGCAKEAAGLERKKNHVHFLWFCPCSVLICFQEWELIEHTGLVCWRWKYLCVFTVSSPRRRIVKGVWIIQQHYCSPVSVIRDVVIVYGAACILVFYPSTTCVCKPSTELLCVRPILSVQGSVHLWGQVLKRLACLDRYRDGLPALGNLKFCFFFVACRHCKQDP